MASRESAAPMRWIHRREEKYLSRFEAAAADRAFATVVVNERERDALRAIAPHALVDVVRVGVDIDYLRPPGPPATEPRVVFSAVMNYAPNEQGAEWLVR